MSKEHSKPIYINELYASLNTKKRADTCGNSVTNLSINSPTAYLYDSLTWTIKKLFLVLFV